MYRYYYFQTRIPRWEEIVVSFQIDLSPAQILIWDDGITSSESLYDLYRLEYVKKDGDWIGVDEANLHIYLTSNLYTDKREVFFEESSLILPPGFSM